MPRTDTASSTAQGVATATYRSGLKLDGAWHPYADQCPKVDVRPGDTVQVTLEGDGRIAGLEVTARGTGTLPPETISTKQRELLEKIADDREASLEDLERFLQKFKGKGLAELSKGEAGCLLDLLIGGNGRGPRRRR